MKKSESKKVLMKSRKGSSAGPGTQQGGSDSRGPDLSEERLRLRLWNLVFKNMKTSPSACYCN